jgi:ATP-dependent Clp protease ATP-binding subunit ClpB
VQVPRPGQAERVFSCEQSGGGSVRVDEIRVISGMFSKLPGGWLSFGGVQITITLTNQNHPARLPRVFLPAMNTSDFTEKVNDALKAAHDLALSNNNVEIAPLHMAAALFDDATGLATSVCRKTGASVDSVKSGLTTAVNKLAKQTPPPETLSPNSSLIRILRAAQASSKKSKDTHVSVDHVLVALVNSNDKPLRAVFDQAGLTADAVSAAVESIRGGRPVTSATSDQTFESLDKFGVDLVALAEQGKLDPVIGRDEVTARVIRVLSRRTKVRCVFAVPPVVIFCEFTIFLVGAEQPCVDW